MQKRKEPLITGEYYHVFTKSIAGYVVFNNQDEYLRMKKLLKFHHEPKSKIKFAWLDRFDQNVTDDKPANSPSENLIRLIAYCLMPTHVHLFLRQKQPSGISIFMSKVLNSYARYFNLKHKRKGPLWEGRFKNVRIQTDEQALHLSRYIHLNPTSAGLVDKPDAWDYSSYHEYLSPLAPGERLCDFKGLFDISPMSYKRFVERHQNDQRELAIIKSLLVDS